MYELEENIPDNEQYRIFLSQMFASHSSNEHFCIEYNQIFKDNDGYKNIYLHLLIELKRNILNNNDEKFKYFSLILSYVHKLLGEFKNLTRIYEDTCYPFKSTNILLLACKCNKNNIIDCILDDANTAFKYFFSPHQNNILPDSEDETHHNVFYYVIRFGNVKLLNKLINKWPDQIKKIDQVLSKSYEELLIRNVSLSDEISITIEQKLINLRFYSDNTKKNKKNKQSIDNIIARIDFICENIILLSSIHDVHEKFLFIAKNIAQNIHVLKRQLKSTYDSVPWEEIEFCLISFILSYIKTQELNFFYQITLSRFKIITYLTNFANHLTLMKNTIALSFATADKLNILPNLDRNINIYQIIHNHPEYKDLYKDYQQIRDVTSLEKINNSVQLATSTDPTLNDGQLIIMRSLQVIGEHLKNTLESPKMSEVTSDTLLLSLPKTTRKIIIELRNSLSHAYSLYKRNKIKNNATSDFFLNIQNDLKTIHNVVEQFHYTYKMKIVKLLLKQVNDSENFVEIKQTLTILSNCGFDKIDFKKTDLEDLEKLKKLINDLQMLVTNPTKKEKEIFKNINLLISTKNRINNLKENYEIGRNTLQIFNFLNMDLDKNSVRILKYYINAALKNMNSTIIESNTTKQILNLCLEIAGIQNIQIKNDKLDEINRKIQEIHFCITYRMDNIAWVQELRYKLNKKYHDSKNNQKNTFTTTNKNYDDELILTLNQLKNSLNNLTLINSTDIQSNKINENLLATIETLTLDILSILGNFKNCLEDNFCFLDCNFPILIGKSLRNHLAHDNSLSNILFMSPIRALILNAQKLVLEKENIIYNKIGRLPEDNVTKLRQNFNRNLLIINNQQEMFSALERSDLEDLKKSIVKGADVHAKNNNLKTALHFAANGNNFEIIKFLLDRNLNANARDTNLQTPLHVAAAYGTKDIIQFLIKNTDLSINDIDNKGKTPLHYASENGNKNAVDILLKYKAKTSNQDFSGQTPIHYAVAHNHEDIVRMLLKLESNVDINETKGGFTLLHIAAEKGHLNLVNYLIKCKANVNAKTDGQATPVHLAALNGHLEVVKYLILNGSIVNTRVVDGCTPLHYAVENGHEKIAAVLLKNGVDPNITDKVYYNTPLHYAAKDGHLNILKSLLKYKANVKAKTKNGTDALHLAILSGHWDIVDALLVHGFDVNDKECFNYLDLAISNDHTKIISRLLKYKINVNVLDDDSRQSPIFVAALKGKKEIFDILMKHKANLNVKNIDEMTLLHAAAYGGNKDIINILLQQSIFDINAKTKFGITPIFLAVTNGNKNAVETFVNNQATVDIECDGIKLLHAAIIEGDKEIIELLLKYGANINAVSSVGCIALHLAIVNGNKDIFKLLIQHKAKINMKEKSRKFTPISLACQCNEKEMVELLINEGADVNADEGLPILYAVLTENEDIFKILLKNKASIHKKYNPNQLSLLHVAAKNKSSNILSVLISKGINVNCETPSTQITPLQYASELGNNIAVDILLSKGAHVNCKNIEGLTALHSAAFCGHTDVVETLLNYKVNTNIKDKKGRIALAQAVAHNRFDVVKLLLPYSNINNYNGVNDFTILHIAAGEGNLEMVKYLVVNGADINAINNMGSKPIHVAARDGYKNIVEYFCNLGQSVNEIGRLNATLLHYAAQSNQSEVIQYLITHGANVNAKNDMGNTPLSIACKTGSENVVKLLLENGANYSTIDTFELKFSINLNILKLLRATDQLFKAVKSQNVSEIQSCINAGVQLNTRDKNNMTALHYATWKGYEDIIDVLLQNNSNPNVTDENGFTSLHYAAKFNYLTILKTLLIHGAVYDAISKSGKSPADLASDKNIINLLKSIQDFFEKVKSNDSRLINDLKNIKDIKTIKAIMGTKINLKNKTLIAYAIYKNYNKVEELKKLSQNNLTNLLALADSLIFQEEYNRALVVYNKILLERREILGDDNPGTLDIQREIATLLYKQQKYDESLRLHREIYEKFKVIIGDNKKDTLNVKSAIALILHRQGKNNEALDIYRDIYPKQKEILSPNDKDLLNTQLHMALVLNSLEKFDEALDLNYKVYENRKKTLGVHNSATLSAQNNIAMVLSRQQKYVEALDVYREVFKMRTTVLGPTHSDTLRSLYNIGGVYQMMKNNKMALEIYEDVLKMQKQSLGPNHVDTLNTQDTIGQLLLHKGKHISAFKMFNECLDRKRKILGSDHPDVLRIEKLLEVVHFRLKIDDNLDLIDIIKNHDTRIKNAIVSGDLEWVKQELEQGINIDGKDSEGRTLMHFAADNGNISIIKALIKYGVPINQVTNKGNTTLHISSSKGYIEVAKILLENINRKEINHFINARTSNGGTSALHVAAKNGHFEIVKLLLKKGAIYNLKNNEDKTALDISKNQKVIYALLKRVEESFESVKRDKVDVLENLSILKSDELLSILNTHDDKNNSLVQVAIINKHREIAKKLLTLLKTSNE